MPPLISVSAALMPAHPAPTITASYSWVITEVAEIKVGVLTARNDCSNGIESDAIAPTAKKIDLTDAKEVEKKCSRFLPSFPAGDVKVKDKVSLFDDVDLSSALGRSDGDGNERSLLRANRMSIIDCRIKNK